MYTVFHEPECTRIHFAEPMRSASWAPVNGGTQRDIRDVLNCTMDPNVYIPLREPFDAFLHHRIHQLGCYRKQTIALSTSVPQAFLGSSSSKDTATGLHVAAFCTAGLGNAVAPGDHSAYNEELGRKLYHLGTINIIVAVNRVLSYAALYELSSTVTLAKASVMAELDIRSKQNNRTCMGTGTDCVVICARMHRAAMLEYAGLHTRLAELASTTVRQAFLASIKKRLTLTGTHSDAYVIATARARFLAQR